jgi:hypothetical protein
VREAAPLVQYLAEHAGKQGDIAHKLESDQTISASVRAAAIEQAQDYPLYWPAMLEGHRAAERRDWGTAVDAFGRVAELSPHDTMHWYWLAMASLAANQSQTYERACKEISDRITREMRHDYFWAFQAWLVSTPNQQQLTLLAEHRDAHDALLPGASSSRWLYALRTGQLDNGAHTDWAIPDTLGIQPEDWYVLAMISHKRGDVAKAHAAFQAGASQARLGTIRWDTDLFREMLQCEVQALLSKKPTRTTDSKSRATAGPASVSGSPPEDEQRTTAHPAASK